MQNTHTDLSCDIRHNYLPDNLFALPPPRRVPKYEIRKLLVETFHLIYYMTTFQKL